MYSEYEELSFAASKERVDWVRSLSLSTRSTALQMTVRRMDPDWIVQTVRGLDHLTLRGICERTKNGEIAEYSSALGLIMLHPKTGQILAQKECYADPEYYKFEGDNSVQMTWMSQGETIREATNRLIREEIFGRTRLMDENLNDLIVPIGENENEVIGHLLVADALVNMKVMMMTEKGLGVKMGSRRVRDHQWMYPDQFIRQGRMRAGVKEMVELLIYDYMPINQPTGKLVVSELNQRVMAI